jgi:long-chain acyl-CoA synthetase
MTYAEFGDATDQCRSGLAGLGIEKGYRVAIIADNRKEWAIAAYGAYGLGAAVVPMYESQRDDNWHFILRDSGASVVVVANEDIRDRIAAFKEDLPHLDHIIVLDGEGTGTGMAFSDLLDRGKAKPVEPVTLDTKEIAGLIYTSGTTGNPKGVVLSQENFASNVSAVTEVFPIEPSDRTLSFLPWAHSFGQTVELHTLLSRGASTAFAESVDSITENMAEVAPTMLVSVPRVFNRIHEGLIKRMEAEGGAKKKLFYRAVANASKRRELAAHGKSSWWIEAQHRVLDKLVFSKVRRAFGGNLKFAISGGAAIAVEVANFIDNLGITVYEGYGLSETSPIVTANWPGSRKIGTVGKPIPGVRVEIDLSDQDDEESMDGEIIVYGHNVMQGYHRLPEENESAFTPDGGFRTGDLGRVDSEGFLVITGRLKEQYKLENGKYVVPGPLEETIALSPYIANAMVYGFNRPFNVALVVLDQENIGLWAQQQGIDDVDVATDERVRELVKSEIGRQLGNARGYERVREFAILPEDFTVDNGMLTPTLKLKRRVVVDNFADLLNRLYD